MVLAFVTCERWLAYVRGLRQTLTLCPTQHRDWAGQFFRAGAKYDTSSIRPPKLHDVTWMPSASGILVKMVNAFGEL